MLMSLVELALCLNSQGWRLCRLRFADVVFSDCIVARSPDLLPSFLNYKTYNCMIVAYL